MLNGFFVVNKPPGLTSHDVVARIRKAARQKRVGHAGTLDPAAEGILLVCVGPSTRISDYLMGGEKRYTATIELGATTNTDDAEGEVLETRPTDSVTVDAIRSALSSLTGEVLQVPPMFSALKINGTPLYRLARKGLEVVRAPRPVSIYSIDLLDYSEPLLVVDVRCGKGTYIRSLARDVGERLGCGAHMRHLVRTASGRFDLAQAVGLADLVDAVSSGRADDYLRPPDDALLHLDAISVESEGERRLTTGSAYLPDTVWVRPPGGAEARVYTAAGLHVGIAAYDESRDCWQPRIRLTEDLPTVASSEETGESGPTASEGTA